MKDIIGKFRFKANGVVLNAPKELEKEFQSLGFSAVLAPKNKSANTLVFVNNEKDVTEFLKKRLKQIESDSVFWIAYPKGTSGIKTDINRDTLRAKAEEYGITTVTAVSIDDTWSALRFRPTDQVGK